MAESDPQNDNAGFFILATAHYGAQMAEVYIRLRSAAPDKQLIELDLLMSAIVKEALELREKLTPAIVNGGPRLVRP